MQNLKYVPRSSFKYALSKTNIEKAVEIGVQDGINAEIMLNNGVKFLYLVDPFLPYEDTWNDDGKSAPYRKFVTKEIQESSKRQMLKRLEKFNGRKEFYEMTSKDASTLIPDGSLDYIYIDGCHDYTFVKEDLELWYPKLKGEGVFAGHDFAPQFAGLIHAVLEFGKKVGKKVVYSEIDTDWWMK